MAGSIVAVLSRSDLDGFPPFRALVASCSALTGGSVVVLAEGVHESLDGLWRSTSPGESAMESAERAAAERGLVFVAVSHETDPVLRLADHVVVAGRSSRLRATPVPRERVHPLRARDAPEAIERLARTLAGRRVALVLGAGGIRGFAHPGVLEVFEEERIPVDLMAGASVGAIAAALYLSGTAAEEIADVRRMFLDALRVAAPGFGVPTSSVWSGRRLRRYLRAKLGDLRFEDLPVPLAIVTAEYGSRREIVLDSGPLVDAVVASAALPGLYPAVLVGRRRLIDGGLVNPVPITAARERGAGVVVAVNVMSRHPGPPLWRLPNVPVLGRAINTVPSLARRTRSALSAVRDEIASLDLRGADVVIEPRTDRTRPWELLPARALRNAGREAAAIALPQIRELLEPKGDVSRAW